MAENLNFPQSWGRLPYPPAASILTPNDRSAPLFLHAGHNYLPLGNGRSYGDSCVNSNGILINTHLLDRFIDFDPEAGTVTVEAGVLLDELLRIIVPHNWFLPVTPGTRFVTVGGALANDVHGKNHHRAGTFGQHVISFELVRSTGEKLLCSREDNAGYFAATIGGLGLTGLVTWVRLQLKSIDGPWLMVNTLPFNGLDDFFYINQRAEAQHEYSLAWIDCLAKIPRGIHFSANHDPALANRPEKKANRRWKVGFTPPFSPLNQWTLKTFNHLYFNYNQCGKQLAAQHYLPFFYPLDGIESWNRLYGKSGFYQYQCAIPTDAAPDALTEILATIAQSGQGSFLAVLKTFANISSPGLLSFPIPGATLALDFANRNEKTHALFKRLDHIVAAARGRLYPAKDAHMSGTFFRSAYPIWEEFSHYIDPYCSSNFWRRVLPTNNNHSSE